MMCFLMHPLTTFAACKAVTSQQCNSFWSMLQQWFVTSYKLQVTSQQCNSFWSMLQQWFGLFITCMGAFQRLGRKTNSQSVKYSLTITTSLKVKTLPRETKSRLEADLCQVCVVQTRVVEEHHRPVFQVVLPSLRRKIAGGSKNTEFWRWIYFKIPKPSSSLRPAFPFHSPLFNSASQLKPN